MGQDARSGPEQQFQRYGGVHNKTHQSATVNRDGQRRMAGVRKVDLRAESAANL